MKLGRWMTVLGVSFATGSIVVAGPADKKKAPAPEKAAATGSGSGSGSADAGSAVQMQEDAPPSDINGTDENPDAPRALSGDQPKVTATVAPVKPVGYPIEEALRPITLPANMAEVSIDPHATVSPFANAQSLHARYGITEKIQLGLTYLFAGYFESPTTGASGFHSGKAMALDLTVGIFPWMAVRGAVPMYFDSALPSSYAAAIQLGVPLKFTFGDKYALGGLDDLLSFQVHNFVPSLYQEVDNAAGVANVGTMTSQPTGHFRVGAYGVMQYQPNFALIGRFGVDASFGSAGGGTAGSMAAGGACGSGTCTFLRAGVQYTPRHYLDIGGSLGFDDLAHGGSFSPAGYLAFRI